MLNKVVIISKMQDIANKKYVWSRNANCRQALRGTQG